MDSKIREIFAQRVLKMRSSSGTISLFAEAYIAVTIVMGLCFYLIFTLQAVINQTGFGGLANAVLFSAVFIPMISVMFFYLVDSVQIRNEPADPFKNLKYVIISLPLLPLAIFLPIDLPIYIKMSIALIAVSIFPMIKFERESRRKKSVENMLPNFIRDIAEVRKTGLSPERCIQQVAKQDYGRLSKYIRKMSAQISWGIPIRKVMQSFSDSINVWSAKAVTFVLLEVVDLGGGTSKMFENMAEFTQQMKEIAREQVSNLRPLIIVPYFGAVMLIATTLLMMGFLTGASGTEGATSESGIQIALLTGAVGQSWVMGFASGKMGEGSVGAGFKHAIALVFVSLLTIYVIQFFV
jgi:flagellar protein FlaJ